MVTIKPALWKVLLGIGAGLILIAFILGWIGFGVPDWHAFRYYNGSMQEYYGLWAYCQQPPPLYNSVCKHWGDAATELYNGSRPTFISTSDGLITTGMILLSLGAISCVFAALLPLLAYLAGILSFLGFLFLVIGVPIFGVESNNLSKTSGDVTYNKRYGFWFMIPTIILSFLASLLFIAAGYIYQKFGFGNLATHTYTKRPNGGQQLLGPANMVPRMPYGAVPYMMPNPYMYPQVAPYQGPSLLSQYIAQRMPQYYSAPVVRPTVVSVLPQPSIARAVGQPTYISPAYYRPTYATGVNLTGRSLVGPVVQSM